MTQAAFPQAARLRQASEFRAVFGQGRKRVSPGFVVIFAPGEAGRARMGLALAKRRIARSVDRNRVKRVLRESFRHHQQMLGCVDIVVLARSRTAAMSNADLFAQLAKIWPHIARSGRQSDTDRFRSADAEQR